MLNKIFPRFFGIKPKKSKGVENRNVEEVSTQPETTFKSGYQKITAKQVAADNGIEYISDAKGRKMNSEHRSVNRFYAKKGKYILLHPANDGMPTCPFEWYGNFDGKPQMIMNNQHSFKGITNLNEIILQMVKLYVKYIDEDMFIASAGFAIRLDDKVHPDYHGKAIFVLTKDSIRNAKVKPEQIIEAKKYFINDFLDHYIGRNFGATVTNNSELEKALIDFNNLVIEKGLRKYADTGFEVWHSEDVRHYDFKRA